MSRTPNRPLAKPKTPRASKPLTVALMTRIKAVIEKSGGKITQRSVATEIGITTQRVNEYLGLYRSVPYCETTAHMILWLFKTGGKEQIAGLLRDFKRAAKQGAEI